MQGFDFSNYFFYFILCGLLELCDLEFWHCKSSIIRSWEAEMKLLQMLKNSIECDMHDLYEVHRNKNPQRSIWFGSSFLCVEIRTPFKNASPKWRTGRNLNASEKVSISSPWKSWIIGFFPVFGCNKFNLLHGWSRC